MDQDDGEMKECPAEYKAGTAAASFEIDALYEQHLGDPHAVGLVIAAMDIPAIPILYIVDKACKIRTDRSWFDQGRDMRYWEEALYIADLLDSGLYEDDDDDDEDEDEDDESPG